MNRRHFVRLTALAAAACGFSLRDLCESGELSGKFEKNETSLPAESLRQLASAIAGNVVTPESAQYDRARSIFNRAFDRRPAVIVQCAAASDVARALGFAQNHNVPLAVRAGGHSRLGYGICDGGVVIDLSRMKQVEVDPAKQVARAQAGALVRDLDQASQPFGLATTSGGCPTVGVAGLTLGGGEGRLMAKFGAACDNLLSAEVVTVDGRRVDASPASNADLFWAIRGGGGNFGVVTALEFQLHPVAQVLSGALNYPPGRIPELLQAFVHFIAKAPDEMDAFVQVVQSERGPKLKIDLCYFGDPQTGNDLIRPLRALKPQDDSVKVVSYLEAQAAGGFLLAPVAHFQTNRFLPQLSVSAISAIATAIDLAPAMGRVVIVALRGAISRVNTTDTAFALRQPGYEVDIVGTWSASADKAAAVRWVQTTRDSLQPFARGVYVNQLGDTSEQLVRSAYGPNYARLVEIKKKYDPANVLRLNQNIDPDSPAS
jgi:FAD/FMN-containing dehydrogenase